MSHAEASEAVVGQECAACAASGEIRCHVCEGRRLTGVWLFRRTCKECGGAGTLLCDACDGRGTSGGAPHPAAREAVRPAARPAAAPLPPPTAPRDESDPRSPQQSAALIARVATLEAQTWYFPYSQAATLLPELERFLATHARECSAPALERAARLRVDTKTPMDPDDGDLQLLRDLGAAEGRVRHLASEELKRR